MTSHPCGLMCRWYGRVVDKCANGDIYRYFFHLFSLILTDYYKYAKTHQLCLFWDLLDRWPILLFSFCSNGLIQASQNVPTIDIFPFPVLFFSFCWPCFVFCFLGNYEISSISHVTMSPSRQNNLVSMYSSLPLSKSSYSVISAFCTEDNVPQCITYINQVWFQLICF